MCTALLGYWVSYCFHIDIYANSEAFCKVHIWMVYAATDLSIWILVVLTVERVADVYLPVQVKKHCTKMTPLIAIAVTAVVMFGINSAPLYVVGRTYYESLIGDMKILKETCATQPGHKSFEEAWSWVDLCLYSLLPLVIITVSNGAIIFDAKRRTRQVQAMRKGDRAQRPSVFKVRKLSSMTTTMLVLNTVLITTTIPVTVSSIASKYILQDTPVERAKAHVARTVLILLMYTNNAVKFALYCISSSQFWKELGAMFREKRVLPRKGATAMGNSSSSTISYRE